MVKKPTHIPKVDSMPRSGILSVFGYTDYRVYLQDFYQFKKDAPQGYSHRNFAKKAGFSAPNVLKLVVTGERNISAASLPKFIKALGLTGRMAAYFGVLVRMNNTKDLEQKSIYYQELVNLTPAEKKRNLDPTTMEYLSHAVFPVLREMAIQSNFCDDPYWIVRRLTFKVSIKEVKYAFGFLLEHKFLTKNQNGKYIAHDNLILSSDEIKSLAVRRYHKCVLDQSHLMLETLPLEQREFGALTFTLPEESFDELKLRLKEFRRNLLEWALKSSEANQQEQGVIQVNIQMYPQTRKEMI